MEKLIEALNLIKTTCLKYNNGCGTCPMYSPLYEDCVLYSLHPNQWSVLDTPETITRVVK